MSPAAVHEFDLLVVGDANPDVVLSGAPRGLAYGQREELVAGGGFVLPAARPGERLVHVGAPPADPVDTVGAGDSSNVGFLAARLRGLTLRASMRVAAACGSLSTRAAGGTAAQPLWDEVHLP